MNITLKHNSVITLMGPSHCGKTTTAKMIKDYCDNNGKKCFIVSSDAIRRKLANLKDDDYLDPATSTIYSDQAFKTLEHDIRSYAVFPVNADVIVVDTTGLDKNFRDSIQSISREIGYVNQLIAFNLSNNELISRIKGSENNKRVTEKYVIRQNKRLKEDALANINRKSFDQVYTITSKDTSISISFENGPKVKTILNAKTALYGDIHGCFQEFVYLYSDANNPVKGYDYHVLVGDYLDKNSESNILTTITAIESIVRKDDSNVILIKGNHETFVYNAIKSGDYVYGNKDEDVHFVSIKYLLDPRNASYKDVFIDLYENYTYDYAELVSSSRKFIVSHSHCDVKYLGKNNPHSLRAMRNTRTAFDNIPAVSKLDYLFKQKYCGIGHIFGHVEVGKDFHTYKDIYAIDQGCVSGGHLTRMTVDQKGDQTKVSFDYKKSSYPVIKELLDFSEHIKPWSNNARLDEHQERTVRSISRANPIFISPTMCPAPSLVNDNECSIESVGEAIKYLVSKDITDVIAQKKHMGSRATVYLEKEGKSRIISRGGHEIRDVNITENIISSLMEKYKDSFDKILVIDGELMPWSAIGKGLVDKEFNSYYHAVKNELDMLKSCKLKFGFSESELSTRSELIEKYKTQLDIYSENKEPYFEPFGVIYRDGKSMLSAKQSDVLNELDIPFNRFDISTEEGVNGLISYYHDTISDGKTEGIVIKPNTWYSGMIPGMKVRNPEYLRIIYGYDYDMNLQHFASKKSINGKANMSISEQKLNVHLAKAYTNNDIDVMREIYKAFVLELEKEKGLDPRL